MSHTPEMTIETHRRDEWIDLTGRGAEAVDASGVRSGTVTVFVPHTTAGVTINENADPDVVSDVLQQLDVMVPWKQGFYRHTEGNTAAHVKASMMGSSVTVLIQRSKLKLGRWQGIYFCEFDGPRTRSVWLRIDGNDAAD